MKEKFKPNAVLRFTQDDINIHRKKNKYQGFFQLNEYHLSHKLFAGGESEVLTREVFERGDAVVLIPYDPIEDKVLLLEQFRPGAIRKDESPWLLEFVAGMFSEHEKPEEVAIREAKEEADLYIDINNLLPVMNYFSSPGGMSERIYLFVARVDLISNNTNNELVSYGLAEEGEDILTHVMSKDAAIDLLAQGKISNAATVIGLQWLALNYQKLQLLWSEDK
ncbi:MAG: NUDIX domain-containing protein [Alteromonadaceae bacterium]|nr:NUDIX domain-containing protein [Alteromonadaceae bacterium]